MAMDRLLVGPCRSAGPRRSNKEKNILMKEMTPAQIAKGQELASEYWEKYAVPFQKN